MNPVSCLNYMPPEILKIMFRHMDVDDVLNLREVDKQLFARVQAAVNHNLNAFVRSYVYSHFKTVPLRYEILNDWPYALKSLRCLKARNEHLKVVTEQKDIAKIGLIAHVMLVFSFLSFGLAIAGAKHGARVNAGHHWDHDALTWVPNTQAVEAKVSYDVWINDLSTWT